MNTKYVTSIKEKRLSVENPVNDKNEFAKRTKTTANITPIEKRRTAVCQTYPRFSSAVAVGIKNNKLEGRVKFRIGIKVWVINKNCK